ncbi:ABC transporter ATP-binding protein [Tepidiforma sp.]|uniref:ABC transporter ATP-binding protein n=1 Tax=Tepidiforma sp. TaxID=2682230 RepID=UPI002ADDB1CB|nr:ABC transporter ATP-binding protein [Tepidiforma sp.]
MLEARFTLTAGKFRLDVALQAGPGVTVLFGPSGSGKSLTLRCIAGLVRPQSGRIVVDGVTAFDSAAGLDLAPHRRRTGFAGQSPSLFPHLTVERNVAFGLREGDRSHRLAVAARWLQRLGLEGFERRNPRSLSGGQAQRVALARALAPGYRTLLLDEPFSALDEALRQELRVVLAGLAREQELTILFVTHDLREAHLLANYLAVIDHGRILQTGARDDVFRRPASRRVAELLGATNLLRGKVVGRTAAELVVEIDGWTAWVASWYGEPAVGEEVDVVIRPERVVIRRGEPESRNVLPATIVREFDYGPNRVLEFVPDGPGPCLVADLASRPYDVLGIAARKRWLLELPAADLHAMPVADPFCATTQ